MGIVGGFDIHRRQITFDYVDTGTGEVSRGKIAPADRAQVRSWLGRFDGRGDVAFALEGCTGWRFVVEELARVGAQAHLAEPADTAKERGRKQRAKTDRTDARLLRELLAMGRLPESWIPPDHVLEVRARVRLYKALADERRGWMQRIRATLFHQGAPALACHLLAVRWPGPSRGGGTQLLGAPGRRGRPAPDRASRGSSSARLRRELVAFGHHQIGCRALQGHFGIGGSAVGGHLGGARRLPALQLLVRRRAPQRSGRHGVGLGLPARPGAIWPGKAPRSSGGRCMRPACRQPNAPPPTTATTSRSEIAWGPNRAALSVGRKLGRRCYHTLRELGDDALAPVA